MKKRVVILGNGFDIELGLPTSYRSFIESPHCQELTHTPSHYLINRIVNNYKLHKWVDIEEELKAFAIEKNGKSDLLEQKFEDEYAFLVDQLRKYLSDVSINMEKFISKVSISADFLRVITTYPTDFETFSFNYTDLNRICRCLGLPSNLRYRHVHGSLADNSIIIGFEDTAENISDFCYMIKTFHPAYSSHHLRKALFEADEIFFFGISLGSTDYHYFSHFFKEKSMIRTDCKPVKITFITANNRSHISILEQLRKMNDSNTNLLFDQNDIEFLYTTAHDGKPKAHYLFQRLLLESEADSILNN